MKRCDSDRNQNSPTNDCDFVFPVLVYESQYIQTKTVLKQNFDEFNELLNDPNHKQNLKFNVNLPSVEFTHKKKLPVLVNVDSVSGQRRQGIQIDQSTVEKNPGINGHGNDFPVSLIAQRLFDDNSIIDAFKSLYLKYIDDENAPFMLNISSQNRKALELSLDEDTSVKLNDLNDKELLSKLVPQMDQAALEVCESLFGSFARFQTTIK